MGLETNIQVAEPVTSKDSKKSPKKTIDVDAAPQVALAPGHNLWLSDWLFRSRQASFLWLIARLWLGYEWLNAGYQKIWGSERGYFWFGGGAAVKGFAVAGVKGSTAGTGGANYGWFAAFLHNFVEPNASALGKVVSLGELLIGIGLIVGLFTGVAALAGLLLNITYMFSGSAGVNTGFAIVSVFLILAWRNAGEIGLDGLVFRNPWVPRHLAASWHRSTPVLTEVQPVGTSSATGGKK